MKIRKLLPLSLVAFAFTTSSHAELIGHESHSSFAVKGGVNITNSTRPMTESEISGIKKKSLQMPEEQEPK
jgi:hypothetical protein